MFAPRKPRRLRTPTLTRPRRIAQIAVLAVGLAAVAVVAVAGANTFTLMSAPHTSVTDVTGHTTHADAVTTRRGFVVYILTGDSAHHPKCTSSACLEFWPPVTVASARSLSKAPGVSGRLGTWRHKGFDQVTIDGHPLYRYAGDSRRRVATGEGIRSFGGVWRVRDAGRQVTTSTSSPTTPTTTTPSPTTTTTPPYTY